MTRVIVGIGLVMLLSGNLSCIALGVAAAAGGIGAEAGYWWGQSAKPKPPTEQPQEEGHAEPESR